MKFGVCINKNGYVRDDLKLDLPAGVVVPITDEQALHLNELGRKGSVRNCYVVGIDKRCLKE